MTVLPAVVEAVAGSAELIEPTKLFQALANFDNAEAALVDHDQSELLFSVFHEEHGYFPRRPSGQAPADHNTVRRWAGLLRWVVSAINGWEPSTDKHSRMFIAILIVAQALDAEGSLWDLIPAFCVPRQAFIGRCEALVRSFSISFGARRGAGDEAIWEREAIDQFQLDDAQGNWAKICESIRLFEHSLFLVGFVLRQTVRCLYHFDRGRLVGALSENHQTLMIVQVASVLNNQKRLRLAEESSNPYVEFGCVFQALADPNLRSFGEADQQTLTGILLKVAQDELRWASWMQAFNTNPNRRPALQEPLGKALATSPLHALSAYVEALQLSPQQVGQDLGRSQVANCLRTFRASAAADQRGVLWRLAHDRWVAWNFGTGAHHMQLIKIHRSQLDYAIVGYATECMDNTQRATKIRMIAEELLSLDQRWFAARTDLDDAWNRLLSILQPYAHADQITRADGDWLAEATLALPFDPSDSAYLTSRHNIMDVDSPTSSPPVVTG